MNNLEFKKKYQLSEIIDIVKRNIQEKGVSNDNFCLYTKDYIEVATPNIICYLEKYPIVSGDDEEVYPDFVVKNSLEIYYYGQQFEGVIFNVLHQKSSATIEEFISALNYYDDNDTFMDF